MLIFVINCNLQRLDGPVTGNGKIINELEGIFEGAGWNVIRSVQGVAVGMNCCVRIPGGKLIQLMNETVARLQTAKSKDGATFVNTSSR